MSALQKSLSAGGFPLLEWTDVLRRFTLRNAFNLLYLWQQRHSQRIRLAELDTRLLKDVGLTDHHVETEVRKPFWKA